MCFCGSARAAELNDSSWGWTTVEWTRGSSFQRAAIIWTGLTGLLRGGLSKNTPYLCDSMMTLTSAAVSLLIQFLSRPVSLPLLPRRAFWSRDKPFSKYPQVALIQQEIQQRIGLMASFSHWSFLSDRCQLEGSLEFPWTNGRVYFYSPISQMYNLCSIRHPPPLNPCFR